MTEHPRPRTLVEIARLAGTSPATVSRALAGSPLVSDRTRHRIQSLADQHHFQPNPLARTLRAGTARMFAGIIPETASAADCAIILNTVCRVSDFLFTRGCTFALYRQGDTGGLAHSPQLGGLIVIAATPGNAAQIEHAWREYPVITCPMHNPGENLRALLPAAIDNDMRNLTLGLIDALRREARTVRQAMAIFA